MFFTEELDEPRVYVLPHAQGCFEPPIFLICARKVALHEASRRVHLGRGVGPRQF